MTNYREILRLHGQGLSQRSIAASCDCGKTTVQRTVRRAQAQGLEWPLAVGLTDEKLRELLYPSVTGASGYKEPDVNWIHREMGKPGVTLSLLWNEYCGECRQNDEIPLMYSQFCKRYREHGASSGATMHIERRPGEQMEVDWAGQSMKITDGASGETAQAYIFVAALSYSGYAYVEAFASRNQENWIGAHVNAYRFFGGVTRILVPDNLKTGVTRADRRNPIINREYQEMAEHYGTAMLPARVKRPQDKPTVEGTVGNVSTWILAALRDWKFFSLREMNEAIREKLDAYNCKPFQKKPGSRFSVFTEAEAPLLMPLPDRAFEFSQWKVCVVNRNYHVPVEKMYYSVPYTYIKQRVEARVTREIIEIFSGGTRIASHVRRYGSAGQYTTFAEHMPEDHRKYIQWNAEYFLSWAHEIGENTQTVV